MSRSRRRQHRRGRRGAHRWARADVVLTLGQRLAHNHHQHPVRLGVALLSYPLVVGPGSPDRRARSRCAHRTGAHLGSPPRAVAGPAPTSRPTGLRPARRRSDRRWRPGRSGSCAIGKSFRPEVVAAVAFYLAVGLGLVVVALRTSGARSTVQGGPGRRGPCRHPARNTGGASAQRRPLPDVLKRGNDHRLASGEGREPVERAGVGSGLDLGAEGAPATAGHDGLGQPRGRRRRPRQRLATSARWPARGPSRGAASSTGRMLATKAAGISRPPGPGTLPSRPRAAPGVDHRAARTETRFSSDPSLVGPSAPAMAPSWTSGPDQVLDQLVAGVVRARRRLARSSGGESAQHRLEGGEHGVGARRAGRGSPAPRPTRRDRRRRWRRACSSRLEEVVPALRVAGLLLARRALRARGSRGSRRRRARR